MTIFDFSKNTHECYPPDKGPSWQWSYASWIDNYLCNQYLSPLTLWVWIPFMVKCTGYNIMWSSLWNQSYNPTSNPNSSDEVVWNQSYNPTSNPNSSDEVVWNQSYNPTSNPNPSDEVVWNQSSS